MPQLSVIVPVYKAEQYLCKCIKSILDQSFCDLELILIDDGSPDGCPAICDDFAREDERVRVIHQKNAGVSAARNAGLDAAHGEYITFVDSDDHIELNMYNDMMGVASRYCCDVVMCDCIKEFGAYDELYTHAIRPGFYDRQQIESEYFQHILVMPNVEYPPTISNCLLLFRNKKEMVPRYEVGIRYSEDLLFGAQLLYRASSFYYMKGQGYYHYNCTNVFSATHASAPDKWRDYQRLYNRIVQEFGSCPEYNFQEQIDKVLLFFVYNAAGEILHDSRLRRKERIDRISDVLEAEQVRQMFSRICIRKLPVSKKLKLMTWIYKHCFGLGLLCDYMARKR